MKNELQLIKQSDLLTFTPNKLSTWQINFVTNLMAELQPYFNENIDWFHAENQYFSKFFPLNINSEYVVDIPFSKIENNDHKKEVLEEIIKLRTREITYEVTHDDGTIKRVICLPISTIYDYKDSILTVGIPLSALRWFLYYGENVKLTILDKKSVLALNGTYAKRLFQILSSHYKEIIFKMPISELMYCLAVPNYTVQDFEKRILKNSYFEINTNPDCLLAFKYRLTWENDGTYTGGKKGFNTVTFKIYNKKDPKKSKEFKKDNWSNRINDLVKPMKIKNNENK